MSKHFERRDQIEQVLCDSNMVRRMLSDKQFSYSVVQGPLLALNTAPLYMSARAFSTTSTSTFFQQPLLERSAIKPSQVSSSEMYWR